MAFEKLIELRRCHNGVGTFVTHSGRELAVFRLADPERLYVIDNACPHASGNLAGGDVVGNTVTCPWHHWTFELTTGRCCDPSQARVRVYPAQVRNGEIWVDLG